MHIYILKLILTLTHARAHTHTHIHTHLQAHSHMHTHTHTYTHTRYHVCNMHAYECVLKRRNSQQIALQKIIYLLISSK